jgi:hypothetical protein
MSLPEFFFIAIAAVLGGLFIWGTFKLSEE